MTAADIETLALSTAQRLYAMAHEDLPGGKTQRLARMQLAITQLLTREPVMFYGSDETTGPASRTGPV